MGEEGQDTEEEMLQSVIQESKMENGSGSWMSSTDSGQVCVT